MTMNLLAFSYGATCGWASSSIPILRSDDTPLETGPISISDASWIASGNCFGGFFGNLLVGWVRTQEDVFAKFNIFFVVTARSQNRSKGFAVHRRTPANPQLGFNLLRQKSFLHHCVANHRRIRRWRHVCHRSLLHFGDF